MLFSLGLSAQEKTNTACKALSHGPIFTPFGGPFTVTVSNDCKSCNMEGPDHCDIFIFDAKSDTVGRNVINGLPKYNESINCQVFLNPRYPKKQVYDGLRISIPPYCDHIKPMRK
jgi:hypothetical protein